MPLKDLYQNDEYLKLSPEAREIVFDRVRKDDDPFNALSPEAQEIVGERVAEGKEGTERPAETIPVSATPFVRGSRLPIVNALNSSVKGKVAVNTWKAGIAHNEAYTKF